MVCYMCLVCHLLGCPKYMVTFVQSSFLRKVPVHNMFSAVHDYKGAHTCMSLACESTSGSLTWEPGSDMYAYIYNRPKSGS
jgi:hypothetical protein